MSMLTEQCHELRERASALRQGSWSDGAKDAALMEQAADTIEGLRCRAHELEGRECDVSDELDGVPRCSLCGNVVYDEYRKDELMNFCSECGARVRKESA